MGKEGKIEKIEEKKEEQKEERSGVSQIEQEKSESAEEAPAREKFESEWKGELNLEEEQELKKRLDEIKERAVKFGLEVKDPEIQIMLRKEFANFLEETKKKHWEEKKRAN